MSGLIGWRWPKRRGDEARDRGPVRSRSLQPIASEDSDDHVSRLL